MKGLVMTSVQFKRSGECEVVFAYPGTGKTYAGGFDGVLDARIGRFKYKKPICAHSLLEAERLKASPCCESDICDEWPMNYYHYLSEVQRSSEYRFVLAPPIIPVMVTFEAECFNGGYQPYTLVYPRADLADEYLQRYKDRGNAQSFIEVFYGDFAYFITYYESMNPTKRVVLGSGQYVSDYIEGSLVGA